MRLHTENVLVSSAVSCRDFTMHEEDIDKAADVFLALWQENIRLWAAEKELLTPHELATLLDAAGAAASPQGGDT